MTIQYKGQRARVTWEYLGVYSNNRNNHACYTMIYVDGQLASEVHAKLTGKQIRKLLENVGQA